MKIEWAYIMKGDEVSKMMNYFSKKTDQRKTQASVYLESHKSELISAYHEIEKEEIENFKKEKQYLLERKRSWQEKKCQHCGSKLRFISAYGFWGCYNYRDSRYEQHTTFHSDVDADTLDSCISRSSISFKAHWFKELKTRINAPECVKGGDIVGFLRKNNLPDLVEKYCSGSTLSKINSLTKTKAETKVEEQLIVDLLKDYFPTHLRQVYIKYKEVGKPKKHIILDLLLSDSDAVYVVEIKRSPSDIKEEQLNKYHEVIRFIMNEKNDHRALISTFVVTSKGGYVSPFNNTPYVLHSDLMGLGKSWIVQDRLVVNQFKYSVA